MKSLMFKNAKTVNLLHQYLHCFVKKSTISWLIYWHVHNTAVAISNSTGEIQPYNIHISISTTPNLIKIFRFVFQITRVFIYLFDKIEWYSLNKNDVKCRNKILVITFLSREQSPVTWWHLWLEQLLLHFSAQFSP